MSASVQLQKAIKTVLEADATLISLWGGAITLYDHVPDEAPLPYLFYDVNANEEWDTSTEDGWECLPRIHVFSDKEGSKFAREVSGVIEDALHNNTTLSLTGYRVVLMQRLGSSCVREDNGQVWHSLSSFRALIEEN